MPEPWNRLQDLCAASPPYSVMLFSCYTAEGAQVSPEEAQITSWDRALSPWLYALGDHRR